MYLPAGIAWIRDAIDVGLVAFLFYRLLLLARGTRAAHMLTGLVVLVFLSGAATLLNFSALSWLFSSLRTVWLIGIVIIFQPELRRALTQVGRLPVVGRIVTVREYGFLSEIQNAVERTSRKGLGALIVIERNVGLRNYVETGTRLDAIVSGALIETIFTPPSPLHDGAVIVSGNQIAAAGCILPVSQNPDLEKTLGMRHRAAIGVSEETDAVVLVVSEESRKISLAEGGKIHRDLELGELKSMLGQMLESRPRAREVAEIQKAAHAT